MSKEVQGETRREKAHRSKILQEILHLGIVGSQYLNKIVSGRSNDHSFILQNTRFGWIVSGFTSEEPGSLNRVISAHVTLTELCRTESVETSEFEDWL